MPNRFHELTFTPNVKALQQQHNNRQAYRRAEHSASIQNAALGPDEQGFIAVRDSFYMASTSETGWPYVQHRGGEPGFVHVLSPTLLGLADLRGNKQYISLGNVQHNDRVALFFMDYPNQTRLKLLGRVEIREDDPALLASLRSADPKAVVERALLIHVEAFDWNCPQHITPRYTLEELQGTLLSVRRRIAALEDENASLRERLARAAAGVTAPALSASDEA